MIEKRLHRNALRRAKKSGAEVRVPSAYGNRRGRVVVVGEMWSEVEFASGSTDTYYNRFVVVPSEV